MPDFTTTSDGWVFNLEDPEPPKIHYDTEMLAPILGTAEKWNNYGNTYLYKWEKLVREWILKHSENSTWVSHSKHRRYTMKMVIEEITGEEYSQDKYLKDVRHLKKILEYYSTRVQKSAIINGKKYNKPIYIVSPKRVKKQPPLSLKLRLEEFQKQGIIPTPANMKLPSEKMFCKPGQARNPRTQANMDRRSEEARKRYNERYRDRAH